VPEVAGCEWVPAESLIPWTRNPKPHSADNVAEIARNIVRFGYADPIVAWKTKRWVAAGHGRHAAVSLLYREDAGRLIATDQIGKGTVLVRWIEFASEGEFQAYAIANNRLTEANPMDQEQVADLLREMAESGTPVDDLGYSAEDLQVLLAEPEVEPSADNDDAPEPPAEPVSRLGEVYELGPHRLVCGDSTSADSWALLLPGGERLQMVWTDPPYGVAIVGGNHSLSPEERAKEGGKTIQNDALTPEQLEQFLRDALGIAAAHCLPGSSWYIAAPDKPQFNHAFGSILIELDIWRQTLQWVKNSLVMGRSDYHYRHEPIFYGWVPGAAHYFVDDRTQDSVLEFDRPGRSADHPTMKPVGLVAKCIENSSKPGWIIGEPFGGSGTTLIAAAQTGRVARLIELDPRYCDVIRRRWTMWAKKNNREVGTGGLE
jgi:DNA modification methylase